MVDVPIGSEKLKWGNQKAEIGAAVVVGLTAWGPRGDATSREKLKCGKLKSEGVAQAGRPGRRLAARRGGGMGNLGPVGDSGERTSGKSRKVDLGG